MNEDKENGHAMDEKIAYEEMKIKKANAKGVYAKKVTFRPSKYSKEMQDLETILLNVEIEESTQDQIHDILWNKYKLLDQILHHVLHHVDCLKIEAKTSHKLMMLFNEYVTSNQMSNDKIISKLDSLSEEPDLKIFNKIRTMIYNVLEKAKEVGTLSQNYEQNQKNYHVSLKNFKIILDLLILNDSDLLKLKGQFNNILTGYQQSRCLLNQVLSQTIQERLVTLGNVCGIVGKHVQSLGKYKSNFAALMENLENVFISNETKFFVVESDSKKYENILYDKSNKNN